MENIEKILIDHLKDDPAYIKENKINKEILIAKTYAYDEDFLKKLLKEPTLRARFFKNLDTIAIFKINEFISFIGKAQLIIEDKNLINDITYNFYEDKHNKQLDLAYKDNLFLGLSRDIDYKFKTKFHVSYLSGEDLKEKIYLGDLKLYKEEESFKDTGEIKELKYKAYDLLKEDYREKDGFISIN